MIPSPGLKKFYFENSLGRDRSGTLPFLFYKCLNEFNQSFIM